MRKGSKLSGGFLHLENNMAWDLWGARSSPRSERTCRLHLKKKQGSHRLTKGIRSMKIKLRRQHITESECPHVDKCF